GRMVDGRQDERPAPSVEHAVPGDLPGAVDAVGSVENPTGGRRYRAIEVQHLAAAVKKGVRLPARRASFSYHQAGVVEAVSEAGATERPQVAHHAAVEQESVCFAIRGRRAADDVARAETHAFLFHRGVMR